VKVRSTAFGLVVAVAAMGACAEAGGELKGGDLTDAGISATETPPAPRPTPAPCVGTGTRWSDLYRDIFGPDGGASCSFKSNCHGSPDGAGARSPAGIQCFDVKTCRQSMLDRNLVAPKDAAEPAKSVLIRGILRRLKPDGQVNGIMPQEPADYVFSDACLERIASWIRDGLKDE
jgi:hypothetical protein